ncbi:MAG: TetR/AcrR family transcriptional regulator [Saprospiraceae bacterium]|nr:TetR/AcrR family transcriptional regulator [Saprospiraceae bacterium]
METSTEEKIIQAAEKVFVRDGYDGARMQSIADEAEINKAMLHYYFRSKEKLFQQILTGKIKAFLPTILGIIQAEMTILQKFEAVVDGYLKMLSENPRLPIFILFSTYRNPVILEQLPREVFHGLIGFIKKAIRNGELKKVDPEHLLVSMMGMCVFPYVAKPIASHMLGKSDDEYLLFLRNRKKEIMTLLKELVN